MRLSAADCVDAVYDHLVPDVLSADCAERVKDITKDVPPVGVGLELRLGQPAAEGDLCLPLTRDALGRCTPGTPLRRGFASMLQAWTTQPELETLPSIWAEFDLVRGSSPLPNVFFVVPDDDAVIDAALASVGCHLPDGGGEIVKQIRGALPNGARIFQTGVMLARVDVGARFCVGPLTFGQAAALVDELGAPTEALELARTTVGHLDELLSGLAIHLDVGGAIGPVGGVELAPRSGRQADATQWRPILDALVERDLCLAGNRDALLGWIGSERRRMLLPSVFARSLSHVKFVAGRGREPEVKAYIGLQHSFEPGHAGLIPRGA